MEKGRLVEFGEPHELLQNADSLLYSYVQQTGGGNSQVLLAMAEAAHAIRANKIRVEQLEEGEDGKVKLTDTESHLISSEPNADIIYVNPAFGDSSVGWQSGRERERIPIFPFSGNVVRQQPPHPLPF